uniref:RNase H type-1 domain-containing protein n=1 Tax=Setaria italica TaxID=4555 RepID=K3ZFI0_SETIT
MEDCFHAVISCPHARALRQELRKHVALPREEDITYTGPEWLLLLLACARNAVLQAGEQISIAGSVVFLTKYLNALSQIRQQQPSDDENCAAAPREISKEMVSTIGKTLKINVDGAFIIEIGAAAVGVVIHDCTGKPLLTAWRWLRHCRDVEEAEALACLEGIRMAARWADRDMVLVADCSTIIDKLRKGGMDRSQVAPVIMDALHEGQQLRSLIFMKIGTEQNKVAHELAHLAIRSRQCCVSFLLFPECVHALICK